MPADAAVSLAVNGYDVSQTLELGVSDVIVITVEGITTIQVVDLKLSAVGGWLKKVVDAGQERRCFLQIELSDFDGGNNAKSAYSFIPDGTCKIKNRKFREISQGVFHA